MLEALTAFPEVDARTVDRFGKVLAGLSDWDLLRINPLRFAAQHGFDAQETVDICIRGAKIGLFDFAWNMLCPSCGAVLRSYGTVNDITEGFHCALCDVDVRTCLDDQIEVAFNISSRVENLDIDPYRDPESYFRYFFSPNFRRSDALAAYVDEAVYATALIAPDDSARISFSAEPGRLYRLLDVENHKACFLRVGHGDQAAQRDLEVIVLPAGFSPHRIEVDPGDVSLNIRNVLKAHVGVLLALTDFPRLHAILEHHPSEMLPFFTGKMLLNNQSFRDLFRVQHLVPGLKLPLRNLTVLFTDLKGSTQLYDRTGDAFAYSLVREHYRLLIEAVRENAGAVVKTMGDAIMATFSDPLSASRAAIGMMRRIETMNGGLEAEGVHLGLKIGINEGAALAVNAEDRLDYFGQTVNIAARVQALAAAGEIWITEGTFQSTGVEDTLTEGGYRQRRHIVSLRGVGSPTNVYQCQKDEVDGEM